MTTPAKPTTRRRAAATPASWLAWLTRTARGLLSRPPQHRASRRECWHDLTQPEDNRAGQLAEEMREEAQRLADVMNEPTVMYRGLRIPPWLTFTTRDDEW